MNKYIYTKPFTTIWDESLPLEYIYLLSLNQHDALHLVNLAQPPVPQYDPIPLLIKGVLPRDDLEAIFIIDESILQPIVAALPVEPEINIILQLKSMRQLPIMGISVQSVAEQLSVWLKVVDHFVPVEVFVILVTLEKALRVVVLSALVLVLPPGAGVGVAPFGLLLLTADLLHAVKEVLACLMEHVLARDLLHGHPQLLEVHLSLVELLQELPVEHRGQLVLLLSDMVGVADCESPLSKVHLLIGLPLVCLQVLLSVV